MREGRVATVWRGIVVWFCLLCGVAWAESPMAPPEQEVEAVTTTLLKMFNSNRKHYKKDPEAFFREVDKILTPVVAFDQLARYVMGKYAHRSPEQVQPFVKVFKSTLIRFYGSALLSLDDTALVIESVDKTSSEMLSEYSSGKLSRIPVKMRVRTSQDSVEIVYSMTAIDRGWKFRNVSIEGINIGRQFQGQFADAVGKYGSVERVVRDWSEIISSASADGKG